MSRVVFHRIRTGKVEATVLITVLAEAVGW